MIWLRNTLRLVKAIFTVRNIDWSFIGELQENCVIDSKAKIYSPSHLYKVTVGAYSYLGHNAQVSLTEIGKFCSIGPNLICGRGIHPLNAISTSPMFYSTAKQNGCTLSKTDKIDERKHIIIGNDVFIGSNVTILDGIIIGDGAVIGAGAVVSRDIPAYAIVGGVPAKIIKYRFSEPEIIQFLSIKWWNWPSEKLDQIEQDFFDPASFFKKHSKQNDSY